MIVGAFEELEEALSACQIVTVHSVHFAVVRDHHSTVNNTIPDGGRVGTSYKATYHIYRCGYIFLPELA